jgi:class 3 adenylate cyclase/tetratricopeptide (TPR) repeat protein
MLTCPNCGSQSPADFRFCPSCASPLPSPAAHDELRKTVTVLFSDVIGSTSLGERLDPESLRRVMSRYFSEMRAVLERHGGTVEKFIGDAVMAVFGIPKLHEDDAMRAIRAATEMRDALASLNKELERDWGITIESRTGVNTGEVVAGDPSAGQMLVTGDAVNVAARLEQAAQPGEILVGDRTYRLTREAVTVDRLDPVTMRGKTRPVPAFRLLEVIARFPARSEWPRSPMVGREREESLLREAFESTTADRTCRLVAVIGVAGVGKSRLVEEFVRGSAESALVLRGRCLPYGEGITFFPVVEVVKHAAGLGDFDLPDVIETKICAVLEGEEHQGLVCSRVAQVLGASDVAAPEETFWAIRKFLEAIARPRPLVVVFEDVHWAEPTLLDLIEHVVLLAKDATILIVCTSRPELLDIRPGWDQKLSISIRLEPLTPQDSEALVGNLLGRIEPSEELHRRITEAAEGNPLFIEEMLSMLIEQGLLVRTDGSWTAKEDLSSVSVPPTISALIAARLDRLSAGERAVIERASVVGKVFFPGAVAALTAPENRASVTAHLMGLVRRELVHPERSTVPGEDAFRFRHMLIRDVAYGAMPKELRADLHERLGRWLERVAGERVAEQEEIIGYHLEQAHRYRAELGPIDAKGQGVAALAAERLAAAGRRALARGDAPAAINLLERALDLLPRDDPARPHLLADLGAGLRDRGELERAGVVLSDAFEGARSSGDAGLEWRALIERSEVEFITHPERASAERIREQAEQAITVFERLHDDRALARAWRMVGELHGLRGDMAACLEAHEQALDHARKGGDDRQVAWSLGWIGTAMFYGATPVGPGMTRIEGFLETSGREPAVEASILAELAGFRALLGRFEEARALITRGKAIAEDRGQQGEMAWYAWTSGNIERWAGESFRAEEELRRGHEIFVAIGDRGHRATLAADLADALCDLGRYEDSYRFTRMSLDAAAAEDVSAQIAWRTVRAKVLAKWGDLDEAQRVAREAVALARPTDFLNYHGDAQIGLAQVLRSAARQQDAISAAEEALSLYERKGNLVSMRRARALLETLAATSG